MQSHLSRVVVLNLWVAARCGGGSHIRSLDCQMFTQRLITVVCDSNRRWRDNDQGNTVCMWPQAEDDREYGELQSGQGCSLLAPCSWPREGKVVSDLWMLERINLFLTACYSSCGKLVQRSAMTVKKMVEMKWKECVSWEEPKSSYEGFSFLSSPIHLFFFFDRISLCSQGRFPSCNLLPQPPEYRRVPQCLMPRGYFCCVV